MKQSGKILALVLKEVLIAIGPGITTKQVAMVARSEVSKLGAKPAFLNYGGFPDVICVSVNDEVVHGLPSNYIIKSGDVVSVDFGVDYQGLITDAARTILVDSNDTAKKLLVDTTEQALNAGIATVKNGSRVGDIGQAIQTLLEAKGFGVVRTLVGHGVGEKLHEEPDIPNYGSRATGPMLPLGATIAIEPMSTTGSYDVYTGADGWAVITRDGGLSAHFEDTILVTDGGSEIITRL